VDLGLIGVGVALGEGAAPGQEPSTVLVTVMQQVTDFVMEPLAGMIRSLP